MRQRIQHHHQLVFAVICFITLFSVLHAKLFDTSATKACTGIKYVSKAAETCDGTNTVCPPGMDCVASVCQANRYYPGVSCKSSAQCYKGDNDPPMGCIDGTCQYTGKYEGDSCDQDLQCLSNNCKSGKCVAKQVGETCSTNAGTAAFCTKSAVCSGNVCVALNKLNDACGVAGGASPTNLGCVTGLLCIKNKCAKPLTKQGDVCDQTITGHCAPAIDMYCRKNATAVPVPTFWCNKYAQVGQDCNTATELRCQPGLTCDAETKKCKVPVVICQDTGACSGGQKCYCGGKTADGRAIDGQCGTQIERNCNAQYQKLTACVSANCNPVVVSVIQDTNSCLQRYCRSPLATLYSCIKKDVNDRGVSMASIQGLTGSASTVHIGTSLVIIVFVTLSTLLFL